MLAVLDEYHRCCVAVVDRKTARIWELYQDEMSEIGTQRVGADPGRNQDKAEELTKRHFRDVVTMLDKLHRDDAFEFELDELRQLHTPDTPGVRHSTIAAVTSKLKSASGKQTFHAAAII